jgi:hypothetical protein
MRMSTAARVRGIIGLVLHVLVAAPMLFAGTMKFFAPPEMVETMNKVGFGDKILLLATGEVLTAVLLVLPWTSSLGVLLASGFWGGAICAHMSHNEPYVFQSVLLVLVWVGGYLRHPSLLASFGLGRSSSGTTAPQ